MPVRAETLGGINPDIDGVTKKLQSIYDREKAKVPDQSAVESAQDKAAQARIMQQMEPFLIATSMNNSFKTYTLKAMINGKADSDVVNADVAVMKKMVADDQLTLEERNTWKALMEKRDASAQ